MEIGGWKDSAEAWIASQGESGDWSRRAVLDPEFDRILPNVNGLEVLDLGCGEGRYCRKLSGRGAKTTGIDPVPVFIQRAALQHPDGTYKLGVAENLPFEDGSFDLVVSYLTLIDIPNLAGAVQEATRVLRIGGTFAVATISNFCCTLEPWIRDEDGRKLHRPVDGYMEEKALRVSWSDIDIINYHRPLSQVMDAFLECGLRLTYFGEPLPAPEDPHYAESRRGPDFQTMVWKKE